MRGEAIEPRVLDTGVSVVTAPCGQTCVASEWIEIEASAYVDEGGAPVPFERIVRSPAASIQAIQGQSEPAFRVKLKFSPRPDTPVILELGSGASMRRLDRGSMLEASTDGLLVEGEAATALRGALAAGTDVRLVAVSRDTGHRVTDLIPAPDLTALADCANTLTAGTDAVPGLLAGTVSMRFDATPTPEMLASPEELSACRMGKTDRPLHVGRLRSVTGFFAETDTIFVAFDEEGRVEHAYVPGIVDAAFSPGGTGALQVSQAADGNVSDAANAVTGCIGVHEIAACVGSDGPGRAGTVSRPACRAVLAPRCVREPATGESASTRRGGVIGPGGDGPPVGLPRRPLWRSSGPATPSRPRPN